MSTYCVDCRHCEKRNGVMKCALVLPPWLQAIVTLTCANSKDLSLRFDEVRDVTFNDSCSLGEEK